MYLSVIGKLSCQDLNENKKALIEDGGWPVEMRRRLHPLRTVLFYHIPVGIQMYYLKRKNRLTNSQWEALAQPGRGSIHRPIVKYKSNNGILLKWCFEHIKSGSNTGDRRTTTTVIKSRHDEAYTTRPDISGTRTSSTDSNTNIPYSVNESDDLHLRYSDYNLKKEIQ